MSAINRIPRSLLALAAVVIIALLTWKLTPNGVLYPGIGIAALVALVLCIAIYRLPRSRVISGEDESKGKKSQDKPEESGESAGDVMGSADLMFESQTSGSAAAAIAPPPRPEIKFLSLREFRQRPDAKEVAAMYYKMAAAAKAAEEEAVWKPRPVITQTAVEEPVAGAAQETETPEGKILSEEVVGKAPAEDKIEETAREESLEGPALPLIVDETTLLEEDKIQLENAVWYRCENPYCNYTRFLDVHHIVDEKDGGSNKLDNLIVLCPYCHNLAHKNEIPEKEMRDWIANREERFKTRIQWQH